jgi:predicted aspartyl protease
MHRLIAAAAVAAATLAAPTLASADCKLLLLAEFKLDPTSYSPVVEGEINARKVKVLIDSGSTFSSVSAFAVNRLGLPSIQMMGMRAYGIGGDRAVYRAHINELKIGAFTKAGLDLYVAGDDSRAGPAELILGEDVLSKVDTEFDLAHNAIRLFEPKDCTAPQLVYWGAAYSQADLLTWDPEQPAIQTRALINGKQVLAELDSGADQSLIDSAAADAAGVARPSTPASETLHGLGPQPVQSWTGHFDSFALGDEKIAHVSVQVAPFSRGMSYTQTGALTPRHLANTPSMYVGDDFLHAHRVFVDNEDHLILFSYQGGPVFSTTTAQAAK